MVLLRSQPVRLETPHLARRCRRPSSRLTINNPAHRRIVAQAFEDVKKSKLAPESGDVLSFSYLSTREAGER
jgi:hypothetical protein